MFGWAILIAAIIIVAKCAEMDGKSGTKWGFITFGICFACTLIPIPLVNLIIGFVISFLVLFAAKVITNKTG